MSELDSIFSGLDRKRAEGEGKKAEASGTKRKGTEQAAPAELSTKKKAMAKVSMDSDAAGVEKVASKEGSKIGKARTGEQVPSKNAPASKGGKNAERKPVVVHDASAARMSAAQRPKPPADDDDAAFADSRGKSQRM